MASGRRELFVAFDKIRVDALIDGGADVLRDDGWSDFHALLTKRGGDEASLIAFDLLRVEGVDLRLRPLESAGVKR